MAKEFTAEAELLEDYPTITAEDLVNTWAYAKAFSDEIEWDIYENEKVD